MLCDRPFMVLVLARPEVSDLLPRLWEDRGVQHLRLGDLTARASRKLVTEALGDGADEGTVATIAERAAGNACCHRGAHKSGHGPRARGRLARRARAGVVGRRFRARPA